MTWTPGKARQWLRQNRKRVIKLDEGREYWHFRQLDPGLFRRGSFRTITLRGTDIKAVVGHLKP